MHISREETEKRLARADNLVVFLKQKNGNPYGGGPPGPRIPEPLRKIAKALPGSNKATADMLSCRPETVGAIRDERTLKDELRSVMVECRGSALDKLKAALGHISDEKLDAAKSLREVSGVARDMSTIVKDMTPETKDSGLKVIIYNTPERRRDDYDILEVAATKSDVHEGSV
jgi:hypothetical protein